MTVELSELSLTLTQSHEHRLLRVVEIGYAYTLRNEPTPGIRDPGTPFWVSVDILGEDVLRDELLAGNVDVHSVSCLPKAAERIERSFIVGQSVLDEDIGDDEIKLRVCASRTPPEGDSSHSQSLQRDNSQVSAITPMVRGKF